MAFAPRDIRPDGGFNQGETGAHFEYTLGAPCEWTAKHGATHAIYMSDGSTRGARILKTVAHVIVDEDENGAVWERWPIKRHFNFHQ
jgi:hypothetical protein